MLQLENYWMEHVGALLWSVIYIQVVCPKTDQIVYVKIYKKTNIKKKSWLWIIYIKINLCIVIAIKKLDDNSPIFYWI